MNNLRLLQGDITAAAVDAIVNAANPTLLGGGGVDGAIHRAAGPALLHACKELPEVGGIRCPFGEARITTAGQLKARYVIHTVGPRYALDPEPPRLLRDAYYNSLTLALEHQCRQVALPAISCGVYGYPLAEAADIALAACHDTQFAPLQMTFYLFGDDIFEVFSAVNAAITGGNS